MKFEVNLSVKVDPSANFLEVDREYNLSVIGEMIEDCLYDIDDINVTDCEVKQHD